MTLSLTELEHVVAATAPVVAGARVREVHDDGAHTLYLTLRVPGRNLVMVLGVEPRTARLALLEGERPPAPQRPLAFTQQLRKHLSGARVEGLELAVAGDRVVALALSRLGPPLEAEGHGGGGDAGEVAAPGLEREVTRWRLLAELTGRNAALLLVDDEDVVRGSLHHPRDARQGTAWSAPSPPTRPPGSAPDRFAAAGDDAVALGAAIEAAYAGALEQTGRATALRGMRAAPRRELKRAARRVSAIETDRARAEAAAQYRVFGDLLSASFGRLARGMAQITLENFYDEMRPLEIPLDPALAPRQNIERYYARYKKYRAALPGIEARLAQAEERQLALELALEEVEALASSSPEAAADDGEDAALEAATAQLAALGVTLEQGTPGERRRRAQVERALPYRAFASANGTAIWVGRSARQNDALTFGLGRGSDLWLHAAGHAGSHVLVRLERGQDADGETLLDAATLAAHYSKARHGSLIEVHYTRQKHVRRARGGAAGQVYLAGAKTLAVRLEEARLARLLASSAGAGAP